MNSSPSTPASPVLEVRNLVKHYGAAKGWLTTKDNVVVAVAGVSFEIAGGETLGLVGESGCGKSTMARAIMGLTDITSGDVLVEGRSLGGSSSRARRETRRKMQMVFQDPYSSLNPRMKARDIVAEPLRNFGVRGSGLKERVATMFSRVGLRPDQMERYPHEFSGGQRQRIGIARALALDPKLLICDEAVSALDVSVQAQVLNLLQDLQQELGVSYLFVAHDLAVVEHISHRVAVMYAGAIVEMGTKREILSSARHPYTQALLASVPRDHPREASRQVELRGEPGAPPGSGCRFAARCPLSFDRCRVEAPRAAALSQTHFAACHLLS